MKASDLNKSVWDNNMGETLQVSKVKGGYVADINNKYDMDFKTAKEIFSWLKANKYEIAGWE